jgi:hypothetical protein
MRMTLTLLLLAAAGTASAGETFRFDRGVVSTGDSVGTLVQKSGRQPDRVVTLENARGAAVGERWEYYLRDKQVNFETRGGKIVEITEIR